MSVCSRGAGRGTRLVGLVGLVALGCSLGACARPSVVRLVDGVPVEGAYVAPAAYAGYVAGVAAEVRAHAAEDGGAVREAEQARRDAVQAFRQALRYDGDSAELWTRLGANLEVGADEALEHALALDPSYAPAWHAQAERRARAGDVAGALAAAERALGLDAADLGAALACARLRERAGRGEAALDLARELVLRFPDAEGAWRLLAELATTHAQPAWRRHAEAALERLAARRAYPSAPASAAAPVGRSERAWRGVDAALQAGDLGAARGAMRAARLPERLLAARALTLGRAELGRAQAELVVGADPADIEAALALAVALDRLGARTPMLSVLARLVSPLGAGRSGPSELARLLLGELLGRHLGAELAASALEALERAQPAHDPELPPELRAELRARVARRAPGGTPAGADAPITMSGAGAGAATRGEGGP